MRTYLLLAVGLTLASCTTTKPKAPPQAEPIGLDSGPKLDSVVVARPPSFLDKVLGRTPKPWHVAPITAHQPINIGRKSTVAMYYGTANVTTAGKKAQVAAGEGATLTSIGKAKGTTSTAGDATNQEKSTQAAAVKGDGNRLKQDMPAPPPKQSLWQKIRWPLAGVLGTAGLVAACIMLLAPSTRAGLWLLGVFKRKASTDTPTV
jgi:hypothetical protein